MLHGLLQRRYRWVGYVGGGGGPNRPLQWSPSSGPVGKRALAGDLRNMD